MSTKILPGLRRAAVPLYTSNFVNWDGGYARLQVARLEDDLVVLFGLVKNVVAYSAPMLVGVVPVGFRPVGAQPMAIGFSNAVLMRYDIDTVNGNINAVPTAAVPINSYHWVQAVFSTQTGGI